MPVSHPPIHPHPGKPFRTWLDAARDGQVATIRCNLCHRKAHYLAEDLARVIGPKAPVHIPPFPCSRCRTVEYIDIRLHIPSAAESLTLQVRRPVERLERWRWRTVRLSGE